MRRFQSVPASSEHRLFWGWIRFVLGLVQISFALHAVFIWAREGLVWRVAVAAMVASVAAIVSRLLYRGRPDPRIEVSLQDDEVT